MVNPAPHDPVPEVDNPLASKAASELFVRRHWQRRPVVIRQAFDAAALAALTAPRDAAAEPDRELSTATMWALAAEEATEARLIRRRGTRWSLAHGPFAADEQPRPGQPGAGAGRHRELPGSDGRCWYKASTIT